jgi:NADH-quinone oxidoreductase subunit H
MAFELVPALTDLLDRVMPRTAALIVTYVAIAFILANFVMVVGGLMSYIMRKVMARVHTRVGPNRVGPFGLLQFLADGVKMMSKEDVRPAKADKWAYRLAPYLVILPIFAAIAPLAFGKGVIFTDIRMGILFIIAISAVSPIGEIVAGWGSNNKYSTYGAIRAASMDVSYEVPMVISAVAVVILAGSLSTMDIVGAQQPLWFVFLQPIGAFVFFITALAKAGVVPTDLAESESELIAGYFTEYSGMKFGVFQLNVFFNVVFISMLTVLLFFGGWSVPFLTSLPILGIDFLPLLSVLVFLGKTAIFTVMTLLVWFTLPRLRPDQFLNLGWKVLFPLSLLNLVATAAVVYFLNAGGF